MSLEVMVHNLYVYDAVYRNCKNSDMSNNFIFEAKQQFK